MTDSEAGIRYLADENFNFHIVAGLRRIYPEIDVQTAVEAGLLGQPDPVVLAYAAAQGRILLSHDIRTMQGHLDALLASGRMSPGILLIDQHAPIGRAIDYLAIIWGAGGREEWGNVATHLHV
jgi:hypothetical protein